MLKILIIFIKILIEPVANPILSNNLIEFDIKLIFLLSHKDSLFSIFLSIVFTIKSHKLFKDVSTT